MLFVSFGLGCLGGGAAAIDMRRSEYNPPTDRAAFPLKVQLVRTGQPALYIAPPLFLAAFPLNTQLVRIGRVPLESAVDHRGVSVIAPAEHATAVATVTEN